MNFSYPFFIIYKPIRIQKKMIISYQKKNYSFNTPKIILTARIDRSDVTPKGKLYLKSDCDGKQFKIKTKQKKLCQSGAQNDFWLFT